MTITIPPEIESRLAEEAQRLGMTTEQLAVESLRQRFPAKHAAPPTTAKNLFEMLSGYIGAVSGTSETLSEYRGLYGVGVDRSQNMTNVSAVIESIKSWTMADRLELVEAIWDSIAAEDAPVALSEEQRRELDRRLQAYRDDPAAGSSWEEVKKRLQGQP